MAITIDTVSKNKWISGIINQKKLYEDHLVCTSNFLKKKTKQNISYPLISHDMHTYVCVSEDKKY